MLELACGDGSTGRIFRRIQPQCRYIGIEEDAVHRQEAERWLEAEAGTPRSVPIEGKDMGEVDCILCRDRALWGIRPNILRRYSEMLAPDGQMIFVLENGSYFRRLANLFAGGLMKVGGLLREIMDTTMHIGIHVQIFIAHGIEHTKRLLCRSSIVEVYQPTTIHLT